MLNDKVQALYDSYEDDRAGLAAEAQLGTVRYKRLHVNSDVIHVAKHALLLL